MNLVPASTALRRMAAAAGVDALYGGSLGAFEAVPVPIRVASLFAQAHQRVHGVRAAFHLGDGVLRLPALDRECPPQVFDATSVDESAEFLRALRSPGEIELRVAFDLEARVPDRPFPSVPIDETWREPSSEVDSTLHRAGSVVVLAGPGVVQKRAVTGLHDLAVGAGIGVLNTWGAKGVFDWRSRHHLATVGLQEHDFSLGGLADVELILATGIDRHESPDRRWKLAPSMHVDPVSLAPLAERCEGQPRALGEVPPLRSRLAKVTQQGWTVTRSPLPPSRVTKHYGECFSEGLVAADAGICGFWVARTFATTRLGGAIVPSSRCPGFAAACVAVARLRRPNQPALAVVDGPVDDDTSTVLEAAAELGITVPVEVWDPDGEELDADEHLRRLQSMTAGSVTEPRRGPGPGGLAVDASQMDQMVAEAGPVVAWT